MHGNVREWCLDWLVWNGLYTATDPKGVSSGTYRVLRGGGWLDWAGFCDSYDQFDFAPSDDSYGVGFRLSRTLQGQEDVTPDGAGGRADALVEASSASMSVDTTFVDGMTVAGPISIAYGSVDASGCRVTANNAEVANTTANGTVEWTPTAVTGSRFLYVSGEIFMESILRIESCTITFNANGGKSSPASVQKGKGFAYGQLPTATRTGHQFLGWYTATAGGTEVTATTIVTSDTTLYAKWTPNSYSIRFDSNGGTGSMANEPMIYDAAKSLTANSFTRAGYVFAGWATSKDGEVVYADEASVANLAPSGAVTLYARWVRLGANAYAMCFSANGGTKAMAPQMYVPGCVYKLPKCGFSPPAGKRFAGWACSNGKRYDDGMLVFNLAEPGETVTMTAIWV